MLLLLEILMFLMGLWGLIKGKLKITSNRVLEGREARITGAVLILPIPLALAFSIILSRLTMASSGVSITPDPTGFEFLLVIGALIFAATAKPASPDSGQDSIHQKQESSG